MVRLKSGAASQPRAKGHVRLFAGVPVFVVVRVTLVRVVIAIGLGIVGHGRLLSMTGSGIRPAGRGGRHGFPGG